MIQTGKLSRAAEVYLRYVQLSEGVRERPAPKPLDPVEERILMVVASAHQRQVRLSVKDLMAMRALGSPAMLHNRIKVMVQKGWIYLADTTDARRKQLSLTAMALRYYERLARCMMKAVE